MAKHVIGPAADLPPGERLVAEVAGRRIVIFNIEGEYFGLFTAAPHQGGDLCLGRTTGLVEAGAEPGQYSYRRRAARFCAAPGMAGSSISARQIASRTRQGPRQALRCRSPAWQETCSMGRIS